MALEKVLATGNMATGGSNRSAFGGAFFAEGDPADVDTTAEVSLVEANLRNNLALGGSGTTPGGAGGGGLLADKASATLDRVSVIANTAEAGKDLLGAVAASAGGGGVFFWATTPGEDPTFTIRNSIIAENVSEGTQGGGSGLRLLGAIATVSHTTVAENELIGPGFGSGINAGPGPGKTSHVDLEHSIVASHANGDAVFLQEISPLSTTGTFTGNQFTGNVSDRCGPTGPNCTDEGGWSTWSAAGGNLHDGASPPTYFVDPASSDFHIDGTSPPADRATGSTELIDVDGAARDAGGGAPE